MGQLEVRNRQFDLASVPRDWHGAGRAISVFFDNLSLFFPPGERFFVASVKAHASGVTDPELAEQVRAFCAQEGIHSREHARYNRMLERHGHDAAAMEGRVARLLRLVRSGTPKRWQLGATCALEHYTALMGYILLGDPRVLEGADPEMAALWRWHAAEENEHRSVAFDVYVATGGGYLVRSFTMVMATLIFWAKVAEHQVRMMRRTQSLGSAREWARLGRWLLVCPGWVWKLAPKAAGYFRPGYHPSELDSDHLVDEWSEMQP